MVEIICQADVEFHQGVRFHLSDVQKFAAGHA